MKNNCCLKGLEVPVGELRQQIIYARCVCDDIERYCSRRTPNVTDLLAGYPAFRTKLSMLQDFLFQAKLWCDTILPEDVTSFCENTDEEEE